MTDPCDPALTQEILEDCLQALQRVADQGRAAAVADIVGFARVSPAVARAALQELRTRGLIDQHVADQPVLTDEGRRQAAAVLRRHRLSERLLTDVLGLPWDRVHDEAMRLEHALTPEAEARLKSLLRDPETCPHGVPIPGNGDGPVRVLRALDTVPAGARVRIERVTEEESAFLRYLASLGLLPKAELSVEEVAPFGGPLLVRVGGARYAIGRDVAAKILVSCESEPAPARRRRGR